MISKNLLVIICFIFLVVNESKSQVNIVNVNEFKKYSYNILGSKQLDSIKHSIVNATGFFIRKNKRLFFVTALHVLTGCKDDNNKIENYPDSLFIVIKSPDKNKEGLLIPIVTKVNEPCTKGALVPDFVIFEMPKDMPELNKVKSVENYFSPAFASVNEMYLAGFPGKGYWIGDERRLPMAKSLDCKISDLNIPKAVVAGDIDTINFWMQTECHLDSIAGFSGGPVFMKDTRSNRWRVAGITVGAVTNDKKTPGNFVILCRIDLLMKELNRL